MPRASSSKHRAHPRNQHSFPTRRSSDLMQFRPLQPVLSYRFAAPPLVHGDASEFHRAWRSEEHTSELQSQSNLVCRLLLEKKKIEKEFFTGTHSSHNYRTPNQWKSGVE